MLLMTLLAAPALAGGSLVWLEGERDPAFMPEVTAVSLATLAPSLDWGAEDDAGLQRLRVELSDVRPLADAFDGELQIMSRLDAVISDLDALRTPEDAEVLHAALLFQGFAVQRYFQDTLSTDPAAAPYRAEVAGRVVPRPWADAVALAPDRDPAGPDIPGQDELRAFDEVRALVRLAPKATLTAAGFPDDTWMVVNGRRVDDAKAYVAPGDHRVMIEHGGVIVARLRVRLAAGQDQAIAAPVMMDDFTALAGALAGGVEAVALEPRVRSALSELEAPVMLALPGRKEPVVYEVVGASAILRTAAEESAGSSLSLRVSAGAGWLYDGEFYLEHADEAPYDASTVNAVSPTFGLSLEARRGWMGASVGADLALPLGPYSVVSSRDQDVRLRAHPYLSVGTTWLQASAGLLFPWHPSAGLRANVPLGERFELTGAAVYGIGTSFDREEGLPPFEPGPVMAAWAALAFNPLRF